MKCQRCGKEVKENSKFCSHCGANLSDDDAFRCPHCKGVISSYDNVCPHCNEKLKWSHQVNQNDKKGLLLLVLVGVSLSFCLIPFIGTVLSVISLVLSIIFMKTIKYAFDSFILSIISTVLCFSLLIMVLVYNLNNVNITDSIFFFMFL